MEEQGRRAKNTYTLGVVFFASQISLNSRPIRARVLQRENNLRVTYGPGCISATLGVIDPTDDDGDIHFFKKSILWSVWGLEQEKMLKTA